MIFGVSRNGTNPETAFIVCKNTSGATISQNCPVYFEHDEQTDGIAISQCSALIQGVGLFAGILDAKLADDSVGLVQVYGYRQSCQVSGASAGCEVGIPLLPVKTEDYLTDVTSANANAFNCVTLMETIAASASRSATLDYAVFIRAL